MRHRKLIQITQFFFISSLSLYAQFAPGVEWFKIETEHFKVIFPYEIAEEARSVALKAEVIYRKEGLDYDIPKENRWPLILTTSGMVSNGYVTLAPRKSVWFGTPAGEGLSSLDWYDLLGLHEIRHMVQMDSMNRGFIKFLYIIGGQLGLTAGIHLSVPSWFFEGDAVAAETMYSRGGRGRDPLFYSQMKILTLKENFSYQKFVNRSYKDYIPNQYVFGYFMTSYIKNKYGEESWNRILKTASFIPLPALGLYLGAKKVTGKSWSSLFNDMMDELKEEWSAQEALTELIPNTPVFDTSRDSYTNYETVYTDGSSVLARKTSLTEPTSLVQISEEGEHVLFRVSSEGGITSNGQLAVWTFIRPSSLYESQSWSDLVAVDLDTGRKTILSRKARFLSPSFSPDGRSLAVVSLSRSRQSEIQILDAHSWVVFQRFPLPDFPASLSWSEDGKSLFFTLQGREGRSIVSLNLETGALLKIHDDTMETVKRVFKWNGYLIYSSGESGIENIMALHMDSNRKYQISSRPYGVRNAYLSVSESRIYYSDILDEKGSVISYQDLDPAEWSLLKDDVLQSLPYSGTGEWDVRNLENPATPESLILRDMEKYKMREGLFALHSWGISPNLETMTGLRFQVLTSDLMDTLNITAGSEYETNERNWGAFLDLDWKQFYPVINLRNSMDFKNINGVDLWDGSYRVGLSFPMDFRRDLWHFHLNPGVSSGLRAYLPIEGGAEKHYFPSSAYLSGYALFPGSFRSIHPDWGIIQRTGASLNPETPTDFYRFFTDTKVYIPGIFRNNSLSINGALEEQTGQYSLSFPFARGYEAETEFRTYKGTMDYDFPLFYPDLAGGSFFYVSRIRGKLFYDFLRQERRTAGASRFQSVGTELILDLTLANQSQGPFSLGLRYSWLLDEERPVIELIFLNAAF